MTNPTEPMTDLIVAQSIQRSIGDIDLTDRMDREACANLITHLEGLLWKIKTDEWAEQDKAWEAEQTIKQPVFDALKVEAELMREVLTVAQIRNPIDIPLTPEEDAALDELEARASHVEPVFRVEGLSA